MDSFNSRARMGRDSCHRCAPATSASFNSRARMGRDSTRVLSGRGQRGFNSPARMAPDGRTVHASQMRVFQFTRRMGPRHTQSGVYCVTLPFQFTRPHGARHNPSRGANRAGFNSAPAWGATEVLSKQYALKVSIHAPAWGATTDVRVRWYVWFNSRARMGRDTNVNATKRKNNCSNSRARWGATDEIENSILRS